MSRSVEFDGEQIKRIRLQRMVMFSTANVASPNFGTKIYDHLSPWIASPRLLQRFDSLLLAALVILFLWVLMQRGQVRY